MMKQRPVKLTGQTIHWMATNSDSIGTIWFPRWNERGEMWGTVGPEGHEWAVIGFDPRFDESGILTAASWQTVEERPGS